MKKLMYLAAFAAFALASCQPEPEPEPIAPIFPDVPSLVEETLDASPMGSAEATDEVLSINIEAEGAWKVEAYEDYDWIEVTPTSGEGNATLTFTTQANETDKERLAEFEVKETITATNAAEVDNGDPTTKEVKTYMITINQVKKESNVADGALAFLKAIVEGGLLGAETPAVDNWYNVDETFPGITMEMNDVNKLDITSITGTALTGWPEVLDLPNLTTISIRGTAGLKGKELPKEWNTPKMTYCNMSVCKMTGTIPEGLGSTTVACTQFYLDQNHFYGALPHVWASGVNGGTGVCEIFIFANVNNRNSTPEEGFLNKDSDGMGYMIPATFDCRLNHNDDQSQNKPENGYTQGDGTAVKVGGVFQGNFIGYEKGWGQERYEKYDPEAVAGNKEVWSIWRATSVKGGWNMYWYSNLGYVNADETTMYWGVPQQMMDWDQAAADAYTAEAKTKWADAWNE